MARSTFPVRHLGQSRVGVIHKRQASQCQSGQGGTVACPAVGVEVLEGRVLLSVASWPVAPFTGRNFEETIYVNQFGNATVSAGAITRKGEFNGYNVFFDDKGPIIVKAVGPLRTEVAYYRGEGKPIKTAASWGRFGVTRIKDIHVGPNRETLYVGVRAQDPKARGTYDLLVQGPPEGVNYQLDIRPDRLEASSDTDINSPNDYDFYVFTTSRDGNWTVSVRPEKHLDATIIVFDSSGNPVYGSFTRPIDAAPTGGAERWVGRNLKADTTYYVRVDSRGNSSGDYDISVKGTPASRRVPSVAHSRRVS